VDRSHQLTLTDEEFHFICNFVYQQSGIVIAEHKREMVYRRLMRIIRERKLNSFSDYCQLLKTQPAKETTYFINAITTNLTSFFREKHHFEFLKTIEIPRLIEQNHVAKRVRIWSSACSTGEEAYSIAIMLAEHLLPKVSHWDVKLLATDIDSHVLARAKEGIYPHQKMAESIEKHYQKYFQKSVAHPDKVKISAIIRRLITFKQLNLLHQWPMKGPFDVIFCRNVLIYFDKKTQADIIERFYHLLKPSGVLILGHSENLGHLSSKFSSEGRTIFRKKLSHEPL
jgi:chemotaxis protein methyltransferase CheR